jgi:hypothetical protein
MAADATFEDGSEQPLRLRAVDAEDLKVISALIQDAVLPASEMTWQPARNRFAMLLNRFRWEDRENASRHKRDFERVQSVLVIDYVNTAAFSGIHPKDSDEVLSILSLEFTPTDAPSGQLIVTFAGDGAIALTAECLEITLKDVTRPYIAPSRAAPHHSVEDE